jgi:DNA-binding response OmpR family regulator
MGNKKILVVEDDRDVRLGYHARLKANQHDTFFAADALTSISEARKHQPDLIILDLGPPGGDGFVVMDRLKANMDLAMIPVIVVTADCNANRYQPLDAGAKAFPQKPVDTEELMGAIRQCLGEK